MLSQTFRRLFFNYSQHTPHKIHPSELLSKMQTLREHIKAEEQAIEELNKSVRHLLFRSNKKNTKPTKRITYCMRKESDSLKTSKKQNKCGSMPRKKVRLTKLPSSGSSQAPSLVLATTWLRQNNSKLKSTLLTSEKDSTTLVDSSLTLYKSSKSRR